MLTELLRELRSTLPITKFTFSAIGTSNKFELLIVALDGRVLSADYDFTDVPSSNPKISVGKTKDAFTLIELTAIAIVTAELGHIFATGYRHVEFRW